MGIVKFRLHFPAVATILFCLAFNCLGLLAQEKQKKFEDMSLEEMLDVKVSVASKTNMTQRESPGIVTIITQAEIASSGARDLIDVLNLTPGFVPAVDVQNIVSVGIRGSWANEGKVLLLVDGQEFNETLYSGIQLGNHIPVDHISRIEIIRGPGSATYGGYAELGVINIITKSAAEINGLAVSGVYGQMSRTFARRNLSLSFGKQLKEFNFVAHAFVGEGNRSDRDYTDIFGTAFSLKNNSELDPMNLNVGIGFKGLNARFIVDRLHENTRDFYDIALDAAIPNDFNSYYFETGYKFELGKKATITPRFNYKKQSPYQCISESCRDNDLYYGKTAERFEENIAFSYAQSKAFNILAGGDFYYDRASTEADAPDYDLFPGGQREFDYNNAAFYAQGQVDTSLADITVGARFEHHSLAGNSFAPRFAITKVMGRFHFKGLISRAFRAPGISNIVLNPTIKPERTTVMEIETGYQLTRDSILTGNIFSSRIKQPIVYSYDGVNDVETYQNFSKTGTRGFELDFRLKKSWGYANANYSYYRAVDNQVDFYSVDQHPELLLGFPAHKIAATANVRMTKSLALNPSIIYFSRRFGYIAPTDAGAPKEFDPICLVNLNFTWRNIASKGLEFDLGVYDLFAQNYAFIQPYKGGHAPLQGPSREFRVRLGYELKFAE